MANPEKSESMWAASERIAKEPEIIPPTNSALIKKMHMIETQTSFLMAFFCPSMLDWRILSMIFFSLREIIVAEWDLASKW
jgi:hypothetical protein